MLSLECWDMKNVETVKYKYALAHDVLQILFGILTNSFIKWWNLVFCVQSVVWENLSALTECDCSVQSSCNLVKSTW